MEIAKKYVLSERIHFMCPDMYFGIMAEIESVYEKEKFRRCLEALQEALEPYGGGYVPGGCLFL